MGKVLLDGDVIAYRSAFATQDFSEKEAVQKSEDILEFIFEQTMDSPFPAWSDYHIYLTGRTNFRYDVAKTAVYKGNRTQEKPSNLSAVREHFMQNHPCTVSEGEEADDLIAIEATNLGGDCVVVSIDKDFLQVPCQHFNFVKNEWTEVDEFEGLQFFYTQVLTGDAADNIVGIHGIGPKKAEKILKGCSTEREMYEACVNAYGGDTDRVVENARLLWLRRNIGEVWEPPK